MRVGMFLVAGSFPGREHAATLRAAVDAAVAAEDAGFDDVWVAEHHFMGYGLCPSAITLAGYLLGATRRITVGTAVSVLPTAHPVALAEQALLLDQVSDGRFRLGVGRGGPWVDLEVFGTGAARHDDAGYTEALDLLLATLRGPRVSARSAHFAFREVAVTPSPRAGVPHGGVAPVLAATSGSGIAAAAARGLSMLLGMHADDAEKARFVKRYAELAGRPGTSAGTGAGSGTVSAGSGTVTAGSGAASGGSGAVSGGYGAGDGVAAGPVVGAGPAVRHLAAGVAHVEDTDARALAAVRESLPRWLEPGLAGYVRLDGAPRTPRDAREYTDLLCGLHPVGSPDTAVARLTATAEATGIEHTVLLADCTGDPARTGENIARLGAEVLPRLPGRAPPS